ncbi:actin-related protein 8-like isoform X1 [Cynara cardunculus var. scolymus]|uniref:actin-related protein 8-like isoform X1 n=2 Tax=Cynara cardunculus var. scolymus TaxID=59895 RepID=UPI000D62E07E|nr:actin-related protein 8-like isoform X1 [Cynara cardunculus var. scolymus]
MAQLLKKVWESISNDWYSSHSSLNSLYNLDYRALVHGSLSDQIIICSSSIGAFDRLPLDIFMQILKLLGPKEAARLTSVCKSWKFMVSDNTLWIYFLQNQQDPWDSIFFAETNLRSGFPLRTYRRQMQSFMHIYGERAEVPGAVIIDGGAGYCKFGWSKYDSPSGRSATFVEFGNIESPLYSRLRHFFATIYSRMQLKSSTQPIIVSIPISHYEDNGAAKAFRSELEEAVYSALFGMKVPAVCAVSQATLALFSARRTSGILVNIGFHQTSVVPILHGKVMHKVGVVTVGVGAVKLTEYLREQLRQRNLHISSLYTVRSLKENLCYVSLDYEAELQKDTEASYEVASEGWFTLKQERFQTGEILFQPHIAGMHAMGLHQAVAHCVDRCRAAKVTTDHTWFNTIVLAGGTACLPGLAERLNKELHDLLPPSLSSGLRVISSPYGADSAWYGAKLVGNLSTFPNSWCITEESWSKSKRTILW